MKSFRTIAINVWRCLVIAYEEDNRLLVGYFATAFFGVVILFGINYTYKLLVDQVQVVQTITPGTIFFLVIATYLLFEYLSRLIYYNINQYYFDYLIRSKFQNALTRKLMAKLADLDFVHLEDGTVRNLISKVEDTYTWRLPENIRTTSFLFYNISGLVLSLAVALRFDVVSFLLLTLVSTPFYYFRAKYGNASWSIYSINAPKVNYLWYLRYLFTHPQSLTEMKIYELKDHFIQQTNQTQAELLDQYRKPIAKFTILSSISAIFVPAVIYVAITNFIHLMPIRHFSLGDFTFFLSTMFLFSGQISNIMLNIGQLYESSLFTDDYFKLLTIKNTLVQPSHPHLFPNVAPRTIVFDHVSFTYPGAKKPALTDISLTINKGEDIAIVGHNGAGKTTLIKLLFRFYDPSGGTILVDGIDLKNLSISQWYKHLGVLFQDFAKYYVTLKENIYLGDLSRNKQSVAEALSNAQGAELLDTLPKGYDQTLGRWFEDGLEISVGQWQKVAIARALFREAPILVLDEPTSNIDAEAEYAIFNNLKKTYSKKSLVFISHRFSTVRMADRIYVLDHGTLVEHGTHQELVVKKGTYQTYFNLQKKGYE